MDKQTQAQLLDQLQQAFRNNELALKRGPMHDTISKQHMLETRVYLHNAMRLIEGE